MVRRFGHLTGRQALELHAFLRQISQMSMEQALTRSLGRPRRAVTIADRELRLKAATFAGSHVIRILEYYAQVYQDTTQPHLVRMAAGDRLLDRALGRSTQAVETTEEGTVHHVYSVRWLPPDPNDHSNVIEPLP